VADVKTISVYDSNVDTYKKMVDKLPNLAPLEAFIAALPKAALVLDWGCGPGYLAARMRDAGLRPVCVDASAEMVAAACEDYGLDARQEQFSELDAVGLYQGIWANFSLLHAERAKFPGHIAAASAALVSVGLFDLALKSGTGEKRDDLGRLYAYYTQSELEGFAEAAGLKVICSFTGTSAGMSGKSEDWVGLLCKKRTGLT